MHHAFIVKTQSQDSRRICCRMWEAAIGKNLVKRDVGKTQSVSQGVREMQKFCSGAHLSPGFSWSVLLLLGKSIWIRGMWCGSSAGQCICLSGHSVAHSMLHCASSGIDAGKA